MQVSRYIFIQVSEFKPLAVLLLLFLGIAAVSGCEGEQPEPEIVSLTDEEAKQDAKEIREEVPVTMAEGLNLSLWASEKLLADPIALHMDHQGRAWVTVTTRRSSSDISVGRDQYWMFEFLSFESVEDRRNFLRRELSPERSEENAERISDRNEDGSHDWRDLTVEKESIYRIEDISGDGMADRSQLFIRGFHEEVTDLAGGVLYHDEEVFLSVGPDLWKIKDTDGDGIADEKESISHGYDVNLGTSGHGMSGLIMGPAGRIYWGIGDHGLSVVDQEGKRWHYPNQGAILRSDPDGSNFEVFAAGVRNTHEFVFDEYGNLISVDNDGDHAGEFERLVYLVNGSDSGWRTNWQFGKYTDPRNNDYKVWMDEDYYKPRFENQAAHLLPPIAPYHTGPAGMTYNPGTALSEEWRDHFFIMIFPATPARAVINAFTLEPSGASFELETDQEVLRGILSVGIDFGPDGALYLTDWGRGWGTNGEGRIWKLDTPATQGSEVRRETQRLLAADFATRAEEQLLALLGHADKRVRRKAQFELAGRGAVETLLAAVEQTEHQLARIHGIWGIAQLAREEPELARPLMDYLDDPDPEIRAQAARWLGDVRYRPAAEAIVLLLEDEQARVRFFAAEALGRMHYEPAIGPIVEMLEANNDEDVYLRHGGAIALARIGDAPALTALYEHPSEAVRIAAVVALGRMEAAGVAEFLDDESAFVVTNAARAINDDAFIEEALPALASMLARDEVMNEPLLRRAINASLYSGTAGDAQRLAAFAAREGVSGELRVEALATLGVWPDPSVLDRVTGRWRGEIENNRRDALDAIAPVIGGLLTGGRPAAVRIAAAETVGRLGYGPAYPALLALLEDDPSAEVRIAALEALHEAGFDGMREAVEAALDDPRQDVRMTALGMIPDLGLPDQIVVGMLVSTLKGGSIIEQQVALETLGTMQSEAAYDVLSRQLDRLMAGELAIDIQLDLIEAVKNVNADRLNERLEQYRSAKPAGDLLALYRESLRGGDRENGRDIFYQNSVAQCVRCHAVGGRGGDVGPDLSTVRSDLSRKQILESLLDPTARLAPGYGSVTVTLNSGETVQGVLAEETNTSVTISVSGGERKTVQKSDISERVHAPSAMPAMGTILSRSELRDLVEYLTTLTGD